MVDTKLKTFENRLARIDQIHAAGGAFEASGSLGRSYFDSVRPNARKAFPWRGVALIFLGALLLKGTLLAYLGQGIYDARVAELAKGSIFEQAGAWVLHADTATRVIAGLLAPVIGS